MAERDKQMPTAPDDPPACEPPAHGTAPDGRKPGTPLVGDAGPDDFSGLLATLGHYLDRHSPDEVMVLLRAEVERREMQAYASGWRDAAARYEPALREARAANGRTLRLVRRVPGQGAVIPLRQDREEPAEHRAAEDMSEGGAGGDTAEHADPDGRAPDDGSSGGRPAGRAPALGPKSPSSRVPTIPRLRTTLRRPTGSGHTFTPDGGAL